MSTMTRTFSSALLCLLVPLASGAASAGMADSMENDVDTSHGGEAHGDHRPKHGGRVLMYGDLHFEVVVRDEGGVELHLSDAMRAELPAVTVSDVTVELESADGSFETIDMRVADSGGFWLGNGSPVEDPATTTLHLAFVTYGEAVAYALPVTALRPMSAGKSEAAAAAVE